MNPFDDQPSLTELRSILDQVGPAGIWRPVYDLNGRVLAVGVGDPDDGLADELPGDFFLGKRVVDIGCNFGTFSFMAARQGASHTLGVDNDERIIRGCHILRRLFEIDHIDFLALDLRRLDQTQPFDVGMMIDFIGKEVISSGFLPVCLNVIEAVSSRQMLFSIRPVYSIGKHFGGDWVRLLDAYPADVVTERQFLLLDYLRQRFRVKWKMQVISDGGVLVDDRKQTVLFERC